MAPVTTGCDWLSRGLAAALALARQRGDPDRSRDARAPRPACPLGRWVTAAAGSSVEFDSRAVAKAVVDLAIGALLDYLDTPGDDRPAWREHRIEALTRFTISGVTGFTS